MKGTEYDWESKNGARFQRCTIKDKRLPWALAEIQEIWFKLKKLIKKSFEGVWALVQVAQRGWAATWSYIQHPDVQSHE